MEGYLHMSLTVTSRFLPKLLTLYFSKRSREFNCWLGNKWRAGGKTREEDSQRERERERGRREVGSCCQRGEAVSFRGGLRERWKGSQGHYSTIMCASRVCLFFFSAMCSLCCCVCVLQGHFSFTHSFRQTVLHPTSHIQDKHYQPTRPKARQPWVCCMHTQYVLMRRPHLITMEIIRQKRFKLAAPTYHLGQT